MLLKKIPFLLLLCLFLNFSKAQDSIKFQPKILHAEPQHGVTELLIYQMLSQYHYHKVAIDDNFSSQVFDKYIELLDNNRSYFFKSDIKRFERYRTSLDDELLQGKSNIGYEIYNTYLERLSNRLEFVSETLKDTFDFSKDEFYNYNREHMPWFEDVQEENIYWKQRLKYEALSLKLSGKKTKDISDILKTRYNNFSKQIAKSKNEDAFQTYMNAFTGCFDPHTDYFSPRIAEDFKLIMNQSLEGIGATLGTEGDYTKIRELVKGGPADRSKKIFAGDRITAVGQGRGGEMVDVVGWRLDDVVQLIRGKKDTWVQLQIISAGAAPGDKPKIIEIERDKVRLEEQRAKGEIKSIKNNKNSYSVGVINLPIFYQGCTADVKKIITDFKDKKIDAIVFDIRSNTGGSLQEAVSLTGLFIKSGPVCQVRDATGNIAVENDEDKNILWDGPLAVTVNRGSASASEIFSAAIQDYNRGIIIGENTFGKGTVQNLIDLNKLGVKTDNPLGEIKLTIAKFYRINGASTQFRGVHPDVVFPTLYDTTEYGESSDKHALVYDEIPPSTYELFSFPKKEKLINLHNERMKINSEYKYLLSDVEYITNQREENILSINEKTAKEKQTIREKNERKRLNERREARGLKPLKDGEEQPAEENEKHDLVMDETMQIVTDILK